MTSKLSLAAVLLLLAGCSAAEDAANDAADAAADRAKQEASNAVRSAVQSQVCALVGDNKLSKSDITTLSRLLDQADTAGVDGQILKPMQDVVDAGEAKATDVKNLQAACGS